MSWREGRAVLCVGRREKEQTGVSPAVSLSGLQAPSNSHVNGGLGRLPRPFRRGPAAAFSTGCHSLPSSWQPRFGGGGRGTAVGTVYAPPELPSKISPKSRIK